MYVRFLYVTRTKGISKIFANDHMTFPEDYFDFKGLSHEMNLAFDDKND